MVWAKSRQTEAQGSPSALLQPEPLNLRALLWGGTHTGPCTDRVTEWALASGRPGCHHRLFICQRAAERKDQKGVGGVGVGGNS